MPEKEGDLLGVYADRCDGAAYLIDLETREKVGRINHGWWFSDLIAARWVGNPGARAIEVTANFYTGIGPTGMQPFPARFLLTEKSDGAFASDLDENYELGWEELDPEDWGRQTAPSLTGLMMPVLGENPESFEDQSVISVFIDREGRSNPNLDAMAADLPRRTAGGLGAIMVERTGFGDDSVSGDRHYGLASLVEGEWRLELLWRQSLCARGGHAGRWTGELCP